MPKPKQTRRAPSLDGNPRLILRLMSPRTGSYGTTPSPNELSQLSRSAGHFNTEGDDSPIDRDSGTQLPYAPACWYRRSPSPAWALRVYRIASRGSCARLFFVICILIRGRRWLEGWLSNQPKDSELVRPLLICPDRIRKATIHYHHVSHSYLSK